MNILSVFLNFRPNNIDIIYESHIVTIYRLRYDFVDICLKQTKIHNDMSRVRAMNLIKYYLSIGWPENILLVVDRNIYESNLYSDKQILYDKKNIETPKKIYKRIKQIYKQTINKNIVTPENEYNDDLWYLSVLASRISGVSDPSVIKNSPPSYKEFINYILNHANKYILFTGITALYEIRPYYRNCITSIRQYNTMTLKQYFQSVLKIINKIHKKNFSHGDISPNNLYILEDEIYITDFDAITEIGKPRSVLGSRPYYSSQPLLTSWQEDIKAIALIILNYAKKEFIIDIINILISIQENIALYQKNQNEHQVYISTLRKNIIEEIQSYSSNNKNFLSYKLDEFNELQNNIEYNLTKNFFIYLLLSDFNQTITVFYEQISFCKLL